MPGERLKGHCTARVMKTLLKQSAAAKTKTNMEKKMRKVIGGRYCHALSVVFG